MMYNIAFSCDAGPAEKTNDDRLLIGTTVYGTSEKEVTVNDDFLCCVVCDGVGGRPKGYMAAEIACGIFARINRNMLQPELERLIKEANDSILGRSFGESAGMATTASGIIISRGRIVTFNIGNSRIYRFRSGFLRQLTRDHSRVQLLYENGMITEEERASRSDKNIITRYLGNPGYETAPAEITVQPISIKNGDIILLCSDGLSDYVDLDEIEDILSMAIPMREKVKKLRMRVYEAGGTDNISIILAEGES